MKQKVNKWEVLFAVGMMLVLVAGLWGTSGAGLRFGSQVLAASAPQVTNGGNEPSTILASGDGEGMVVPATIGNLSETGIFQTVGIGTASPSKPLHIYSTTTYDPFYIQVSETGPNIAHWENYCNAPGAGSGFLARFARGTRASPANVQVGDRLGFNVFGGWVGNWYHTAAIEAKVDAGTVSATSLPTYLRFLTTPDGSTTRQERMRITASGRVAIGTTSPDSKTKLHVVSSDTTDNAKAVYGETTASGLRYGVYGKNTPSGNFGYLGGAGNGVYGFSDSGNGVYGDSNDGDGVYGYSDYHRGVHGNSFSGDGVYGHSSNGYAGYFWGSVHVTGTLTKGSGSFKIDHPLDPENKYLQHSFVESPDMKNVYDGNIVLDDNGEALVELPSYFEALNRDFRYQLTCIGGYAPVYVADEISGNCFKIAGGKAGMKVSWMVTGIRQDAYANAHPIVVEEEKPDAEKGLYLHPVEWGQPDEKGIDRLNEPEIRPQ